MTDRKLNGSLVRWGMIGFFLLNVLLNTSILFLKGSSGVSLWDAAQTGSFEFLPVFSKVMVGIFVLQCLVFFGASICVLLKRRSGYRINSYVNFIAVLLLFLAHTYQAFLSGFGMALLVFNFLVIAGMFTLSFFISSPNAQQPPNHPVKPMNLPLLIVNSAGMFSLLFIFFVPLYTKIDFLERIDYILIQVFAKNAFQLETYIVFIAFFLLVFFNLIHFISSVPYFIRKDPLYIKKSKSVLYFNVTIGLLFFLTGYFFSFYYNTKKIEASTISFIPLLILIVVTIVHAYLVGKTEETMKTLEKQKENKKFRVEPLFFLLLFTGVMFASLFTNVIHVQYTFKEILWKVNLSGYELITNYKNLEAGYQILSFVLFVFLFTSLAMLLLSLVGYLSKYKEYYKMTKIFALTNLFFLFLLGISGVYFKINQKMNEDIIQSLLEAYQIPVIGTYTYTVDTQTYWLFFGGLILIILMMVRKQLNYAGTCFESVEPTLAPTVASVVTQEETDRENDFDACPVFSELDKKIPLFASELHLRKQNLFGNLTLPTMVRFIVDYARESRLHLSYGLEDVATFVAGLGTSRLAILQGMSGTGKTSLPKIFSEAIMGNCEIVEVESSWRDKNELIGYYNEFSKKFTPKKFTQGLYKAKLNPETMTFIVLDEMNLSRIEYYFSDFLSLMEHEENKRELKLLNIKLNRIEKDQKISYVALHEDDTLQIPTNVWFIGTANRDESTFEISDKVYDRAQTMNFNKRAPKVTSFSKELSPKFISIKRFLELTAEAKTSMNFDVEKNELIRKTEILLSPYNISFGNRILKQMEEFVKIYCACFNDKEAVLNSAIEKILLSKVVSKLEYKNVEDKEELAEEFDKLSLYECSAFVRKLNED